MKFLSIFLLSFSLFWASQSEANYIDEISAQTACESDALACWLSGTTTVGYYYKYICHNNFGGSDFSQGLDIDGQSCGGECVISCSYSGPFPFDETVGCPAGSISDANTGECGVPENDCPAFGTSINLQFSPSVSPAAKGGCYVTQTSDSVCTGTALDGGYCVAQYEYTGEAIENYDPGSLEDSTEWGGTPDSEYTAEGAGSEGSTTTTTEDSNSTTTNNGGGSSTTTDNGDGTSTTVDNGGGTSTTTESGTSTEETESNGTGSSSGNCDLPPSCSGGDPQLCAILKQNWENMCSGESLTATEFNDGLASAGLTDSDSLTGSWWGEEGNTDDLSSDVTSAVNSALNTTGPTGSCTLVDFTINLGSSTVPIPLSMLCLLVDIVRGILFALSYITAGFIMFGTLIRS